MNTKRTFLIVGGCFLLLFIIGAIVIYSNRGVQLSGNSTFSECLGFDKNAGWTVLARPNSSWSVGQAMEFTSNSSIPNQLGNFINECLSELAVNKTIGVSAVTSCESSLSYSLNLSAAFEFSTGVLASLGLNLGSGDSPALKTSIQITSAKETSLDILQIENYLTAEIYNGLPFGCKNVFLNADRFVIAGTYQIEEGVIEIKKDNDINIDLSLDEYKELKDAVVKSGFEVNAAGKIEISKNTPPLIVAVRSVDFSELLATLGVGVRGPGKDFATRMKENNLSIEE